MKRLILTADDFGMARCVNEAVLLAHVRGVLTSASLMINGSASEDAVQRARAIGSIAVGLHVVLVRGGSTLAHRHIPDLVDLDGHFRQDPVEAGLRYFFQPRLRPQIEAEVRAQIEKFLATGLQLDHLDGHMNMHLHPRIFEVIVRLAGEYKIPAVRIPRQPWWQAVTEHRADLLRKTVHAIAFRPLAWRARQAIRDSGTTSADRVYGMLESGAVSHDYLLMLLGRLPEGLTEIYFHPAISPSDDFLRWNPKYDAEGEFLALTSDRVKDLIRQSGIRLVTYSNALEY